MAAWAEAQPGDTAVLCNPNNPTGEARTSAQVLADFAALREKGASLMVDEAFIDYCPECGVRSQVQPGLTVVGSLTKILCIPGCAAGLCLRRTGNDPRAGRTNADMVAEQLRGSYCGELARHVEEMAADAAATDARRETFARALTAMGVRVLPSSCAVSAGGFRTGYDGDRRSTAGKADSRPHLRFLWLAATLFAAGGQDC